MGYKPLLPVTEDMGIKGNIITHEFVAANHVDVKIEETSWLISERFADACQALVTKEREM